MAAAVRPLPQVKLPSGPSPMTAEQRYWKDFKNQILVPSPTNYPVTHVSFAVDTLAVTTGTRVQLLSSRTRKLVKTVTRFGDVARSGEVRPDGRVLVAGDDSGTVQVFDLGSRAVLRTWRQHQLPVWATRWSPVQPTTLLSAGDDATVRLWDLPSSEPTTTFAGHTDYVRCAAFVPGSGLAVSGSYDATVRLWDPRVGSRAVLSFKHAAPVEDVLSMPSGNTLLAAAGPSVNVLDLVAGRPLHVATHHQKTVTSLSLASDGSRLVTGGLEGHVKVLETAEWNVVSSTKYKSPVLCVLVAPAGAAPGSGDRHLAVGMQSGVLSIRTRLTGAEAARDRRRDEEMAALISGDARESRARRNRAPASRLDLVGEGADVVIANEPTNARKKEQPWQCDLRHGRYARALDRVIDMSVDNYSALDALTLLLALRHRGAMHDALAARDERSVERIINWLCRYLCDPRYVSVCVEAAMILIDLYAEFVPSSHTLAVALAFLREQVVIEIKYAQQAQQLVGMIETLKHMAER